MVRNNLVTDLDVTSGTGMVEDHNLVMTDPASFFVDVTTHDFHLVPGAAAIDVGSADLAPGVVDASVGFLDAGPRRDGGGVGAMDGGAGVSPGDDGGCGCSVGERSPTRMLGALLFCGAVLAWRSRRRAR